MQATPASPPPSRQVTRLLAAWRAGDEAAGERLLPLVYDELRRLARHYLRGERAGHTLQPTALVHEAYLRLVKGGERIFADRDHFYAAAAQLMRRVLVDHARARAAAKRGGERSALPLDEERHGAAGDAGLLALDEALGELASLDRRQAQVVELRFFAGLTIDETARVLGVSAPTVVNDTRHARAWLHHRLYGDSSRER